MLQNLLRLLNKHSKLNFYSYMLPFLEIWSDRTKNWFPKSYINPLNDRNQNGRTWWSGTIDLCTWWQKWARYLYVKPLGIKLLMH